MMKKGSSHVDWAISMGIFLIFTLLTLAFLKPGSEPVYKGENLLKILETDLKGNAYYTVEKQLLRINAMSTCGMGPCKLRIRRASENGLDPGWAQILAKPYTAMLNDSQARYNQNVQVFDVSNEYCSIGPCGGYYPAGNSFYVLDIESYIKLGENIFYVIHNDNFTYSTCVDGNVNMPIDETSPIPASCVGCLRDGDNFTYMFGVSESYTGFSEEKIRILETKSYNDLKAEWEIPADKNFRMTIVNVTAYDYYKEPAYINGINFLQYPGPATIPSQTNIFVREWKDWVLTPEGRLNPVAVHIELW